MPSYALHYNSLNNLVGIRDPEGYHSEGMMEAIAYLEANCSLVYTNQFYRYMIDPYLDIAIDNISYANKPTCVLTGFAETNLDEEIQNFMANSTCELKKHISKENVDLIDISYCS